MMQPHEMRRAVVGQQVRVSQRLLRVLIDDGAAERRAERAYVADNLRHVIQQPPLRRRQRRKYQRDMGAEQLALRVMLRAHRLDAFDVGPAQVRRAVYGKHGAGYWRSDLTRSNAKTTMTSLDHH